MSSRILSRKQKICSIEGCDGKYLSRGWCVKHYHRWRKHGDPLKTINRAGMTDQEKFDANIELIPFSTCHYWTGCLFKSGYGLHYDKSGKSVRAHRYSYEMHKGQIPDGLIVRHSCHEPTCVNPDHLIAGSHQDNSDDMTRANRQVKGEATYKSKLTESQVLKIREMAGTMTHKGIGNIFGVTTPTIWCIINRKTWRHLKI